MSVYDLGRAPRRRSGAVRPSPLFLGFLAAAVIGAALAWTQSGLGARLGDLGVFVFVLAGWVVTLCCHEFAHAYAAYRAGDRDVEAMGYLSLNPFRYTHPVLSIVLPLLFIVQGGIGLPGGAVYLHPHAFRSRATRSVAAAVGPAVNVACGAVLLLVARPHDPGAFVGVSVGGYPDHLRFWSAVAFLGFLQITAAVLNLLPVPGLDGYAIIEPYLDPETVRLGQTIKPWGMIGVIVLLQVGGIRTAFFDLVDSVYRWFGTSETFWALGHHFFQFWPKRPL